LYETKVIANLILRLRRSILASQTFLLPHYKSLSDIYVMKEYENEKQKESFSLFNPIRKKLWDC